MTTFQFKAVQLLQLREADNPTVQIEDGTLTISADRDGDQILITTPVSSTFKLPKQVATPVAIRKVQSKRRYWSRNSPRGEDHAKAKLKEQDIREMRAMFRDTQYRNSFSNMHALYLDIAKAYNVHYTTVYKIVKGQSWRHVADA